jgi:dihydrodipicolinate synthase/N-acetylneuraminate lyase
VSAALRVPPDGVIVPMVTPLADDKVDVPAARRVARHLAEAGVDGIFVLGSCGEGATLCATARQAVTTAVRNELGADIPLLAGVNETSTARAAEAARLAAGAGADMLVLTPPQYFIPPEPQATARHVELVGAAVDLPIVLYNIPHLSHNAISPQALPALCAAGPVVGLKDSAADRPGFVRLLAAGHALGIKVYQGAERLSCDSLAAGSDGIVPGLGNLFPGLVTALYRAAAAGAPAAIGALGDRHGAAPVETAADLQARVDAACAIYDQGFWLSALKQAMSMRGLCGPEAAEPLPPVTVAGRAAIAAILREVSR